MYTYAFVVSREPINTVAVSLPPDIWISDTHPMAGGRCTVLCTSGASIEDGVAAVLAVYPEVYATTDKEEAAEWLKERSTSHSERCPTCGRWLV